MGLNSERHWVISLHTHKIEGNQKGVSLDNCHYRGMKKITALAYAYWIGAIGGTLLPFAGTAYAGCYYAQAESNWQAVNRGIRDAYAVDGVVDFDAALRDPNRPEQLMAAFDSGDHLHPNECRLSRNGGDGESGYHVRSEALGSVCVGAPAPRASGTGALQGIEIERGPDGTPHQWRIQVQHRRIFFVLPCARIDSAPISVVLENLAIWPIIFGSKK